MTDHETALSAVGHSYDRLDALIADLGDNEWAVQSLCPDWTVHGVVAHLTAVEEVLGGWLPSGADDAPPFGDIQPKMEEMSSLSGIELAERATTAFAARRAELAQLSAADLERPGMTPVGPGTYGRFMEIRVFDFWVHERDITIPLGRETDDSGAAAEIALGEVHSSMGFIAGKKIGLPDGMSIKFELRGGTDRDICVVVDGRAAVVERLDQPDVTVRADTTTFIMLACGRVEPREQIDAGKISWSGDGEWGEKAASSLKFTM